MKKTVLTIVLATALGACQSTATDSMASNADAAPSGAYKAARLQGTQMPDMNGVWQVLNPANYNIEAHPAQSAMQLRPGPYGPVPAAPVVALGAVGSVPAGIGIVQNDGGKIPYTADAAAMRNENRANWLDRDPEVKCYLPGVPRANYMDKPFQIFQSDSAFFIAYEYAGAVRNVYLGEETPNPDDVFPSWMGESYGEWDGDTFVVEVFGNNGEVWLDRAGNQLSAEAHITERWTKTSPHTMRYEATITDPGTLTAPLEIAFNLYKKVGEDAQLQQFKCVEFVEELMYGHLRRNPLPGPALERARAEAEERGDDPDSIVPADLPAEIDPADLP